MAVEIVMPRLSDSMTEGVIVAWLKDDGVRVERGDALVEIETDKTTTAYEAEAGGVLRILAGVGEPLPVGAPIAQLLDAATADASVRVPASPIARRLARELGLDLASIPGTGPGGRIGKADVEARAGRAPFAAPVDGARADVRFLRPTRTQALIADRMAEASAGVPAFAVTMEVDAQPVLDLRGQLRGHAEVVPSLNDFVVKAAALSLADHPRVNACFRDGVFEVFTRINVGIAVAGDASLLVPTIFDAHRKSVTEIAIDARRLADRVRTGTVTPAELDGATFTVSNLGMYGVKRFTAVVPQSQAAILAVGAAAPHARPDENGVVRVGSMMELTLTVDHRILYGADAAAFLASVRSALERPAQLLL